MKIDGIDHLAITVADMAKTMEFYRRVLGAEADTFGAGRTALRLGRNKLNLHDAETHAIPVAARPTPGAIDICFLAETPIADVVLHLQACDVAIEVGPVERSGTHGPILSVYIRDPDGNLVEIANQL